jgi:uncharacterized BrkB/YihY/UPF0761 family membrane protein
MAAPEPADPKGLRRRFDDARHQVVDKTHEWEARVPLVRETLRAYNYDREVGGEIMAGAIAFRTFVFAVPLLFTFMAAGGLIAGWDPQGAAHVSKQAGLSGIAAQSIAESERLSSGGLWLAFGIGLVALYSTARGLARSLRIAHELAWGKVQPPLKRSWRAALSVIGIAFGVAILSSGLARITEANRAIGFVASVASIAVYAATWLGVSNLLPHGDASWRDLIPGAILVGVGVQVLHIVTILYITPRVSSASALYGPLGAAIAILGWMYLIGRLAVGSAVLNASMYRHKIYIDPK